MKRILSFVLLTIICFCTVGCKNSANINSSDLASTKTELETIYNEEENSVNNTQNENITNNSSTITNSNNTANREIDTSNSSTIANNKTSIEDNKHHSHSFASATCTEARKCSCGETEGAALGHKWQEATCQRPKSCYKCNKIEGEKADHSMINDKCKWCYEPSYTFETTYLEMVDASPILIIGIMPYRYADYRLIITKQNELYKFSEDKKFSNGSHFKKIESDEKFLKFIRFADTIIIVTVDNKVFIYSDSSDRLFSPNETKDTDFSNFVSYSNKYNIGEYKTIFDMENTTGSANFKTENNNILSVDGELLYTFPKGENILLALDGGIIKTTKGFYIASYRQWYEQEFADSDKKLKKEVTVYKKSGYSTINQFFEIL